MNNITAKMIYWAPVWVFSYDYLKKREKKSQSIIQRPSKRYRIFVKCQYLGMFKK